MSFITIERVKELLKREEEQYERDHPRSKSLFEEAKKNFVSGVPMSWMRIWSGGFPLFVENAKGVYITDVDGHQYLDLCLGDTGGLCGHANPDIVDAICRQMQTKGTTTMLPTEDCLWVGRELERRFKLPSWQIVMSASDANRFALKAAREYTGRRLTLAVNATYHGSVDETLCFMVGDSVIHYPGMMGPLVKDPTETTRMVEFNDVGALEKVLATGEIACMITEPAMTNVGIIKPEPGYLETVRELTKKHGTLLLIDETHTMCAGPRGFTGGTDLTPDIFVAGKFIAGGYPGAVLGFSSEIATWLEKRIPWHNFFGFGGTLSGNAAAVAGMRAALEKVLTEDNFARMVKLAEIMEQGIAEIIKKYALDWYVNRIGCRVEFRFTPTCPRCGGEALFNDAEYNEVDIIEEGLTGPIEALVHLYCANRGVLLTPIHEMALVGPTTTEEDVKLYLSILEEMVSELKA
jgi:glutamate-1-semialdehyde 2,1-aminomutase